MIMIGAGSLVAERKVILVPEGLNGERVDAAVARMLGLPRSRVAEMIGTGHVLLDGASINKSDRVSAGSMLEVELADQHGWRLSGRSKSKALSSCTTTTTSW
jgi:23S rRNA-/tRNA-specific pseudouridylate synthase